MPSILLPAALLLPVLGGALCVLFPKRVPLLWGVLACEIPLVFFAARFAPAVTLLAISRNLSFILKADDLSLFFGLLVSVIWLLVSLFGREYIAHEEHQTRFWLFYLLTLAALLGICFSANLATLYLFYELMTLMSLPLVLHIGTPAARAAAMKYLGYSVFGASMGLMGLLVLQHFCLTQNFTPGGSLNLQLAGMHHELLLLVWFLMMLGFGCKAYLFPLHAWLPTVHAVAPAPASAVFSGLLAKMGALAIIRVTFYLYNPAFLQGSWPQISLMVLALLTIFLGSMLALREPVLKRRLAFSSISQMSYALFGFFLLSASAFEGAMLQIFFHALAKDVLFLCAGAILLKTGLTRADSLAGIGRKMPVTMICFTLASLSLIGIPFAGGFLSKWVLVQGALAQGTLGLVGVVVLLVSSILTAGYLLPIVFQAFFQGSGELCPGDAVCEIAPAGRLALCLLCTGLFAGLYYEPLGKLLSQIVTPLF